MPITSTHQRALLLAAVLAMPVSSSLAAPQQAEPATQAPQAQTQQSDPSDSRITVTGEQPVMTKGPEIKGIIAARSTDMIRLTKADGTSADIVVNDATRIRRGGLFGIGGSKLDKRSLLNGLPVTVKTMQAGSELVASQIIFRGGDLRTASMIRTGTEQQFAEQTAATEALRGRMGDIDKYNIKGTTNVYFDTGRAVLSARAKSELCTAANSAENMDNALMLVVGYTDSVGSQEYNQTLSERRAASVINYLQQACRWKPYRMLTPTGMAEADPAADNTTVQGKAQNRRVAVNILVSKGLDGLQTSSR
jgi:OmpA-OmpF porin, OOP family